MEYDAPGGRVYRQLILLLEPQLLAVGVRRMRPIKRVLLYKISNEAALAINTLTGAVDIVDQQVYCSLLERDSSRIDRLDELTLKRLAKRGYLVKSEDDEIARLRALEHACSEIKKDMAFVICPTYSCNLRCTYCFEGELPQTEHTFMSEEDIVYIFKAIDELSSEYKERKKSIELFGGEPLLPRTKHFIERVFKEARDRSLEVGIVTNGVHLPKFGNLLRDNKDIIRSIQITLDGTREIHNKRRKTANDKGTFNEVVASINKLLEMQIRTVVRTNVDRQNLDSVPELYRIIIKNGWDKNLSFIANLSPVLDHTFKSTYRYLLPEDELVTSVFEMFRHNPGIENVFHLNMFRALNHLRKTLSEGRPGPPRLYYCEANNLESIIFGPDGYIYACTECMGKEDLAIGKFRPALEMQDEAVKLWSNRNVLTLQKCRQCDIALLCGGGCAYSALAVNGDINEPVCDRARETLFAFLDYLRSELSQKACA